MIILTHIPRTAGTSFNMMLHRAYGDRAVFYYNPPPGPLFLSQGAYDALPEYFGNALSFSSDQIRLKSWPEFGAATYVVFLRHPVNRVTSEYAAFFAKFSVVPSDIPEHLQEWIGSLWRFTRLHANCMTRFLSCADEDTDLDDSHLDAAKNALAEYDYIGLAEAFEASAMTVAIDYPELVGPFPDFTACPTATPRSFYNEMGVTKISDETLQEIVDMNDLDMALYAHARDLFRERATQMFRGIDLSALEQKGMLANAAIRAAQERGVL